MLDRGGNDMLFIPIPQSGGKNRRVVRFRAAGGEDDLPRGRADARGDAFPRFPQKPRRLLPRRMGTGGIAVITLKNGQRVIITVLDPFQSDVRADKGDIKSFMGRGKKLFDDTTAIDKYVMELRDNDRI